MLKLHCGKHPHLLLKLTTLGKVREREREREITIPNVFVKVAGALVSLGGRLGCRPAK